MFKNGDKVKIIPDIDVISNFNRDCKINFIHAWVLANKDIIFTIKEPEIVIFLNFSKELGYRIGEAKIFIPTNYLKLYRKKVFKVIPNISIRITNIDLIKKIKEVEGNICEDAIKALEIFDKQFGRETTKEKILKFLKESKISYGNNPNWYNWILKNFEEENEDTILLEKVENKLLNKDKGVLIYKKIKDNKIFYYKLNNFLTEWSMVGINHNLMYRISLSELSNYLNHDKELYYFETYEDMIDWLYENK